ncbi:MAG: FHA domain-containing protein [Cyanobacteria bacterium]|nr:FHA domain-containing protein [Cyanobacteriota bacterium]MDA0866401.1 FHA domain-containing protein [Cyanobacteriota bacterium]
MIVCPNCNHQNPDGAVQCEACYTPLPTSTTCPSCGASVQSDASFCGQCGFNLQSPAPAMAPEVVATPAEVPLPNIPPLAPPEPLIAPEPMAGVTPLPMSEFGTPIVESDGIEPVAALSSTSQTEGLPSQAINANRPAAEPDTNLNRSTQLQFNQAKLLHVQTNGTIELPTSLTTVRIGKPNDRIPPDIDVSGFPNSEIVSRVHAQLRVEGDVYYIEDIGSSNGTYVNNMPLPFGNRHRLRSGDRIALGKGDKVTFLFQAS